MNTHFNFLKTSLNGAYIIERKVINDIRGSFSRFFCNLEINTINQNFKIIQINRSITKKIASVRGMHFQYPPYCENKIVTCLKGSVYDVIVDIRKGSSTFLNWYSVELTDHNQRSLFIPKGFAHGFQTLKPDTEMLYFHSQKYHPDFQGNLNVNDPRLSISWPKKINVMSLKDRNCKNIDDNFEGIVLK